MLLRLGWIVLTVFVFSDAVYSVILTPPYFNLAEGRRVYATATCGEDITGPELYCKLVGANAERDEHVNLIQGQVCDYCDPTSPDKRHPAEFAVDGAETWWQSPPLSRGTKYNEVNLTIDLGQEFHVAYVFIKMANAPRPEIWVLERSIDNGKTYHPWQYFADNPVDCETYFGRESLQQITRDDSVICETQYSKVVPLEGGEIVVSLLNNRPSSNDFFNSTLLQEWTRATNIRLRLLRTKTLLGHLMSVARQDPTVTRRYFYSIKDISIGGRCVCNGHADTCDIIDPEDPFKLLCNCQHNTCGANCDRCCPGYEQKAWRISKSYQRFVCEPCNCFGHSEECTYDEKIDAQRLSLDIHGNYDGGGVCQNCRDYTEGINCDRCKPGYFRPFGKQLNETDVCQPCDCNNFYSTGNCAEGTGQCECRQEFTPPLCDSCSFGYFGYPECRPCECHLNGTRGFHCEAQGGQCPCKQNYGGKFCNQCNEGFYNFPECLPCECNRQGALSDVCDMESGQCSCNSNFGGRTCDQCKDGYFRYPDCEYCNCDVKGTLPGICDKSNGSCLCKEGYEDKRCDRCSPGYYGYPDCKPCGCSKNGSISSTCDISGKCQCKQNYAGRTCEQCNPGYYKYPECFPCNCDPHGYLGVSCDNEGKCQCKPNFDGNRCEQCKEGFYNFPICEECNCDPSGILATFAGCGSLPPGELCQCKERVHGRICDTCRPLYWNLQAHNPLGCEECDCHVPGIVGGLKVCDGKTGQCMCKPLVTSRKCDVCSDGTYNLQDKSLFGCTDCGCDVGGSVDNVCDKESGYCTCRPRIAGRTCNEPLQTHYFPTLHQFQYEVEDGHTPARTAVRFGYDESLFPKYSWRGYAVFSQLQNEVIQDIYITKPTIYRMVLRYVNLNNDSVTGAITITPDNPNDIEQNFLVQFQPTRSPAFVTVSGSTGISPSPFVLNPGRWSVSIKNERPLLLDYFVLIPAAYYEGTILVNTVNTPCVDGSTGFCRHFIYPNVSYFDTVHGAGAYVHDGDARSPASVYFQPKRIPLVSEGQREIHLDLKITKPGKHVLLVNYVTPSHDQATATVNIETSSEHGRNKGVVNLAACTYSMSCRQAIIDRQGRVAVFNFDTNDVSITLKHNEGNPDVAIESIVAIPNEEWSLDFQVPKPACVKKDSKCIQATFIKPPNSKRVDFERGNEERVAKVVPPLFDNTTQLIYLDSEDPMVDITGKVNSPGTYVFIVHYFQPDHARFQMDVLVHNGQMYEAKLPVEHCPSNSGCRSIVKDVNGNSDFNLMENFVFTLKEPNHKKLWVDYLLVVPKDQFTERVLHEEPVDNTGTFIKYCGHDHFHVNTSDKGYCRDAVFSLTSDYNNGALPCQCDFDGSYSFECEQFGGQCSCRPNVIGRRCDACKTGYFGFPNCKLCDCPSTALCEPVTGECICPPRVTGEKCDQCEAYTYGFDPIIGCEECSCSRLGVLRGNLQCDLFNGTCECKPNVVGRTCDKCQPGHWAFPHCQKCDCDERGTTREICDQSTAECHCKNNVNGQACDVCNDGTFNIQGKNPDGCTKCFCFGKTTRCTSSSLYKARVTELDGWELVFTDIADTLEITVVSNKPEFLHTYVGADLSTNEVIDNVVYFSAPSSYLGNKLTTYGGSLNYSITYFSGSTGNAVGAPDVILHGKEFVLLYYSIEQPANDILFSTYVDIVESSFVLPTKAFATREQIMQTLAHLQGLYIRATYWNPSITVRLEGVSLDIATEVYNLNTDRALAVEQCVCPPNYQGLSCQDCARGYYRSQTGPYGGFCVPCQCNGHSDVCDQITGVCLDCRHNTTGDHCEKCAVGFHGDATEGTPVDCLICACPLPIPSNNFATGCQVSPDGERISCDCIPGYYGATCQSCAAGFYGRPRVAGDYCKPCDCSGNIDPEDPGSCDSVSGECLRCLNNTSGMACNLCAPGFYGDAVQLKDCQSCVCDKCGTRNCDSYSGRCQCLDNVIGEKCDRCELNHYGYSSCQGCRPCECGLASEGSQCDDATGQCRCKPGVSGRTCDRCAAGFWNYGTEGCASCGCNTEYSIGFGCNPNTGQCECLPGVIGEKCDRCPYRWVLIPGEGCFECNTCTHTLLDLTDELQNLLHPVLLEFESVAKGYFTQRRLGYINETLNSLRPQVDILTPNQTNFREITQEIESLEQDSKNLYRLAEYSIENGEYSADKVLKDTLEVEDMVLRTADNAIKVVKEVKELAASLEDGAGTRVEDALKEAQDILSHIQAQKHTTQSEAAMNELGRALDLLNRIQNFTLPVTNQTQTFQKLQEDVEDYIDKLDDLQKYSQDSIYKVSSAQDINTQHGNAKLMGTVETANRNADEANSTLKESRDLLNNASDLLRKARGELEPLNDKKVVLEKLYTDVDNMIEQTAQEMDDIENVAKEASRHADSLTVQADDLDTQFQATRLYSESAVQAASAYKNIINATEEALKAAHAADNAAGHAIEMSQGLGERTSTSQTRSSELLDDARETLRQAQEDLAPRLEEARDAVAEVQDLNRESDDGDNAINRYLNSLSNVSLESVVTKAVEDSNVADQFARNALNTMSTISGELSHDEEQAKDLPRTVDKTNRAISLANIQINSINNMIPESDDLITKVDNTQNNVNDVKDDLEDKINRVKRQLHNAQELTNRVKVGVTFYPNTTLQLKFPESLKKPGLTTDLSFYFKTRERNGLLLYLGNEMDTHKVVKRWKTDDFLAIEVQNGYPVLIIDIGSGNKTLINDKYVTDDIWYQAIIERIGKVVKFTIVEEVADSREARHESEIVLPGVHSVFDVDKDHSVLFAGGYPSTFNLQPIDYSSFTGQMEELAFEDTPVSLWNFIDAVNNQGALERDKLRDLQPSTGYRFDVGGYVILNGTSYNLVNRTSIQIKFKTHAENGLIFVTGTSRTSFLSVELRNGKVLYQYALNGDPTSLSTGETYNDGQWHEVDVARDGRHGTLQVDNQEQFFTSADSSNGASLETSSYIYFGGHKGYHAFSTVTNTGFDGCIDNVRIQKDVVDLSQNIEASGGVASGCPEKVASLVAFEESSPGYVLWPNVSATNFMQVNFRFKTSANEGLVFYATNRENSATMSLSIIKGMLYLRSQGEELTSNPRTYNDNEWHVVMATHDSSSLRLDVDDFDTFSTDAPPQDLRFLYGRLFFGGVPDKPSIPEMTTATNIPFIGCLGDATINGKFVNFANVTEKRGAILGKCSSEPVASIPLPPPIIEIPKPAVSKPAVPTTTTTSSTTTTTTTSTTPAPSAMCALPIPPANDNDVTEKDGLRFGTIAGSRHEYANIPQEFKHKFVISLDFKTFSDEGVIFYAAGKDQIDYVGLFMKDGHVHFNFNCGSGHARLETVGIYNDGQWHNAKFSRNKTNGELWIDNKESVQGKSTGKTKTIELTTAIFVGSISPSLATEARINLQGINGTFEGCIRNIVVNDEPLKKPITAVGVIPCSDKVENGIYFSELGGYLKVREKFSVGLHISISMDIKPRNISGLLLSVHGKRDFVMLQMINGVIKFSVDNGKGAISSSFKLHDEYSFCDGQWHNIKAFKSKNVVTLSVDEVSTAPTIGMPGTSSTDTIYPLFVGGHPRRLSKTMPRGLETRQQYTGCIRNLKINEITEKISSSQAVGNVTSNICPTI